MKKFRECGNRHADMEGQKEGSYMVARNLHSIKHALDEIIPLVDEHDEIESWIEHKVSVAKEALAAVRDALMYDTEQQQGCGCGGAEDAAAEMQDMEAQPEEGDIDIEVISPMQKSSGGFDLSKLVPALKSNENKYFLGSGSINENRQLITNNSNKKIIVEAVKRHGNSIRVKSKGGHEYEYVPHFGAELEILRCEQYKIKVKK
jgi:hypothetical protein